jgi:hypothetical protein
MKITHRKLPFIGTVGLMGVGEDGTLYSPKGNRLVKLPFRIACWVQKVQHWVAFKKEGV